MADGSAFSRRQARAVLAGLGIERVLEAADGAEAVGLLGSISPDVLVLDWDIRVIRPSDILDVLKGGDRGNTAVLVTMERPSRSAVDEVVALGIGAIVAKPYSNRTMRPRLARLLTG